MEEQRRVMDYRDTLNLPRTDFPMKANLPEREKEILEFWKERAIYEKLQSVDRTKTYILHDGPPYANGHIHMGHALNKILKDIIIKYKTMKGYYAPFVPGWDCMDFPLNFRWIKISVRKNLKSPFLRRGDSVRNMLRVLWISREMNL